jgi:hypothetical protein
MDGSQNNSRFSRLDIIFLCAALVFSLFAATELLENTSLHFINNAECYRALGCNSGFFGFDAVAHTFGGILWTIAVIWIMQQRPKLRLFPAHLWKSMLVLLSLIALLHIAWEIYEFALDYIDFQILQNPYDIKHLAQPGVADTVGDMAFSLLGSMLGMGVLLLFDRGVFERVRAL